MIIEKWFTYIITINDIFVKYDASCGATEGVYIWVPHFLFININDIYCCAKKGNPFRYPDKDMNSVKLLTKI